MVRHNRIAFRAGVLAHKILTLVKDVPSYVKTGVTVWFIALASLALLYGTTITPKLRLWVIASLPALIAVEPILRRHEENMSQRGTDRWLRTEKRKILAEAVALPHENYGRLAKVVDNTQATILRCLEIEDQFDGYASGSVLAHRYRRYLFTMQSETYFHHIERSQERIQASLGLIEARGIAIHTSIPGQKGIAVDVGLPESECDSPVVSEYLTSIPRVRIEWPVGIDENSQLQTINIEKEDVAVILLGGMSGSGKSMYLRSVIKFMNHYYSPDVVRFVLCDLKTEGSSATFDEFASLPHVLGGRVLTTPTQVIKALRQLEAERQRRQDGVFTKHSVPDIAGYRELVGTMPEIFFILDEAATMPCSERDKSSKVAKEFESLAESIAKKGRSAGIHFVPGYQRTDYQSFHPQIRSQATHNICMKVRAPRDAALVLGYEVGENGAFPQEVSIPPSFAGKGEILYKGKRLLALYAPASRVVSDNSKPLTLHGQPLPEIDLRPSIFTNGNGNGNGKSAAIEAPISDTFVVEPPEVEQARAEAEDQEILLKLYRKFREAVEQGTALSPFIIETLKITTKDKHPEIKEQIRQAVLAHGTEDAATYIARCVEMFGKPPTAMEMRVYLFGASTNKADGPSKLRYEAIAQKLIERVTADDKTSSGGN